MGHSAMRYSMHKPYVCGLRYINKEALAVCQWRLVAPAETTVPAEEVASSPPYT